MTCSKLFIRIEFLFKNKGNFLSENKISNLAQTQKGEIVIATHPFIESHINKGWFFNSISHKWSKKFDRKIIITSDERLHLLQYSVVN